MLARLAALEAWKTALEGRLAAATISGTATCTDTGAISIDITLTIPDS